MQSNQLYNEITHTVIYPLMPDLYKESPNADVEISLSRVHIFDVSLKLPHDSNASTGKLLLASQCSKSAST